MSADDLAHCAAVRADAVALRAACVLTRRAALEAQQPGRTRRQTALFLHAIAVRRARASAAAAVTP